MVRHPPDILITTPESLYLLLTSGAREMLATSRRVIVDEIHALVPDKRGAHLFALARAARGAAPRGAAAPAHRSLRDAAAARRGRAPARRLRRTARRAPVTIVDAGEPKKLVCSASSARRRHGAASAELDEVHAGPAAASAGRRSIWPRLHPRLVELVRAHRSTMIFVNSRRLAERLAAALNELAGEELALAHHGSVAREKRARDRGAPEARRSPRDRRDVVARARHRHGRGRSRRPDRGAAVDRVGPPAHRPREPPRRRRPARRPLAEAPRRISSRAPPPRAA